MTKRCQMTCTYTKATRYVRESGWYCNLESHVRIRISIPVRSEALVFERYWFISKGKTIPGTEYSIAHHQASITYPYIVAASCGWYSLASPSGWTVQQLPTGHHTDCCVRDSLRTAVDGKMMGNGTSCTYYYYY